MMPIQTICDKRQIKNSFYALDIIFILGFVTYDALKTTFTRLTKKTKISISFVINMVEAAMNGE